MALKSGRSQNISSIVEPYGLNLSGTFLFFICSPIVLPGMAVKKDKSTALKWFKKAADQDIPKALYAVGQCHEFGFGTSKNMVKAKEYYKKAAELGDKGAIKKLNAQ